MKPQVEQELAHVLLSELLAYQFASPVRWIETQDVVLADKKAERIIEIGPSATLSGMMNRTLKQNYQAYDAALSLQRQVYCYAKDRKEIYYERDPEAEAPAAEPEAAESTPAAAAPAAAAAAAPVAAAAPAAAAAPMDDVPLKPLQVLHTIIAVKLRKPLDKVPVSKTIRDLVGGKSTVQNEILGDLAKEFSAAPEKAEEIVISDLAEEFADSFDGKLGKHTNALVAKLASSKMPGGFGLSQIRKYLQSRFGFGPGRQDAILLQALVAEPAARIGSEGAAKEFLDGIAQSYAAANGLNLNASAGAAGGAADAAGPAVSAEALEAVTKDQKYMARQQLELYARYLRVDLRDGQKRYSAQKEATELLQKELDLWLSEHGDAYAEGIVPIFSPLKARVYDSYWNWARQDCFKMFYDIIWGKLDTVDREIVARCISIINRANPALIDLMLYYIDKVPTHRGPTFELARDLANQLLENCKELADHDPVYKDVQVPTGPRTEVTEKGELKYHEEPRPACRKLEQYVLSMASASDLTRDPTIDARGQLAEIFKNVEVTKDLEAAYELLKSRIATPELPAKGMREGIIPYLHLKSRSNETWNYSQDLTGTYLNVLEKGARDGLTYANKMVLLTGAGRGSIGVKILEGLLSGGAKVIVTTSRFSKETSDYYQSIYTRFGSKDSALVVVPFNQASKSDVKSLVQYIYDAKNGLGWDLDFVIPFAAIPEGGMQIDGIDSKSELAHRLMLTNLLRLLGEVKLQKEAISSHTRPSQVILPLSPNHGTFGSDGLYSESKISLETLFNRWHSENWGEYLTICGAVIGWTRGTGLMSQNNIVAEGIEALGVRTFSQSEMAFNILGLMAPAIVNICQQSPVWADLNGGMQFIPEIKEHLGKLRKDLMDTAELRRAVALETSLEHKIVNGPNADAAYRKEVIEPRANLRFSFPTLTKYEDLPNKKLANLLDLERVPVITGFAEVGPYGNARTRWEMEANGTFSLEGSIEMAWIMGLIKYHNGNIKGKPYSGWIDAKTKEPVEEVEIKNKYESYITEHTGIRLVEPDILSYDPNKKQFLQEVIIEHDLEPFEASKEAADNFHHEQGDKVEVFPIAESDQWTVRFLKGARILIPKALHYNRLVAGQVPTGWDARRYGVPDDICEQVDRVTLYGLVATVEALLSAGVTDPYEFYKYVHVSEVANASGSGMGGMTAMRKMFKDRYIDKNVQNDILQESFINTMSAWVNMLLLSSSGPLRTPVAACATAVESVDSGVDLIRNGTARIVIVGGYDDIGEEGVHEFGNMKATSDSIDELAHGRTPREMSRPTTTTRSGFMESHGSGIQVMMNAKLALEMGVPIYGIVGLTAMASDSIGRSVPAPGKGVMTVAREVPTIGKYPILDVDYRRKQLERRRRQIKQWVEDEYEDLKALDGLSAEDYAEREKLIQDTATRQERDAMYSWGNDFYRNDPKIAPLRGALAAWDLTIDDIGLSSFHGTSTKANDKNESAAINDMLTHLGRSKGNPVFGVFQKYLTGHPKGAAGAWMLNGVLQSLNTGIVPGNRNADNVDAALEQFDRILYPSVSFQTYGIKAATVTSFGFGQKGGIVLMIHPDYLFSTIDKATYETYAAKVHNRQSKVYRYVHNAMCTETMFKPKDKAPYTDEQKIEVYMNPNARVEKDTLKFAAKIKDSTVLEASQLASAMDPSASVGVDAELLSAIDISNETFIQRNFTEAEQAYCSAAADPRASYTGTWSAKEAVFKSLKVPSQGGGAPLKEIEILRDSKGPSVKFHGSAAKLAGSRTVAVSITHNDFQAVAVAICKQ